ncbi:AAA family ATPase [Anabaena azotica]|uniref:AAA family ATPase n=1 Tax=Anabaena azotica TaxID=197653 RepID=UPI0039A580B4
MKIQQLELQNFRCFEHKVFEFSDQFNVIIGDNGTGKTSFCDALRLIIGVLIYHLPEIRENTSHNKSIIQNSDIRQVRNQTIELKFPVTLFCKSIINDVQIEWSTAYINSRINPRSQSPNILQYADSLREKVNNSQNVNLPLVAYYGTGRLWIDQQDDQKLEDMRNSPTRQSRFWGYTECFDPRSSLILNWFRFEIIFGEGSVITHPAILNALSACQIDNWIDLKYDDREDNLVVRSLDGNSQIFNKLSDGVRNMVGMVADIAYRAAVLNPQLGSEAARLTPGIVLIDEIDLHLHPKWQRRVVEDLKRTFPKIQFFATTHSPLIIQSLREGELIDLNNPDLIPAAEYENKYQEYITEYIMHTPNTNRNERYEQMMKTAERYYQMLENANNYSSEELENLKSQLDELIEPYSNDIAYHAFLKMKRLAKLGE